MATTVITGTITDPSGTALASVTVNCRLKPNGTGYRISDSSEIATLVTTTTNGSGVYTLTLERTANITPGNSYYEIEERIPDSAGGARTWAIQVGANPATVLASLVSTPPSSPGVNYLTQSSADARYQATGSFGGGAQIVGTTTLAGSSTAAMRADAQFALSSSVVGSGLALASGVASVSNAVNANLASSWLLTQTTTSTITATVAVGQFEYSSVSTVINVFGGSARLPVGPLGSWVTFTPTVAQNGAVNLSTALGRYMRVGRLVIVQIRCIASGAGGSAAIITVSAPGAPAARSTYVSAQDPVGEFLYSGGGTYYHGYATIATPATPTFQGISYGQADYMGAAGPAATIASTYIISINAQYESAT